jgi:hypothetical protein
VLVALAAIVVDRGLSAWRCISADTAANNKRVTCQHHAADTADGHQNKRVITASLVAFIMCSCC